LKVLLFFPATALKTIRIKETTGEEKTDLKENTFDPVNPKEVLNDPETSVRSIMLQYYVDAGENLYHCERTSIPLSGPSL